MTPNPRSIDLNADLGEGFPNDAALLDLVSSTSISCGAHAGDRETILVTLRLAVERGVRIGAHPGFADREGFGRRPQALGAIEVAQLVISQVFELRTLAADCGAELLFVKPHGALYNQAQTDWRIAIGVVAAARALELPVFGLPDSVLAERAREQGVEFIAEGFPERRYDATGRLVSRDRPDAILNDPAEVAEQAIRLVRQGLRTLCIHGDDPRAVEKAEIVRNALDRHGVLVKLWS